jgi:hypothetical protein
MKHLATKLFSLAFANEFCTWISALSNSPVVVDLSWSSPSTRVEVVIFPETPNSDMQSSTDRSLQLNFEACSACSYQWNQLPNSYTKRIIVRSAPDFSLKCMNILNAWIVLKGDSISLQCVDKEFISTKNPETIGGSATMRYHFLAFKPGRATLIFEYGCGLC